MRFSSLRYRIVLSTLLALLPIAAQALVAIDNVRVYRAPEYTRFVFDVSAPPQYQVQPDVAPGRVVIDFRAAELKANLETVDLQNSPVQRVRSGLQADGTIRVVFDLSVAVRVNSFSLQPNDQYGHRLVVDLYDKAAEQKAKTVEDFVDRNAGPRRIVVAIDAGHGGEDPGARGQSGTREKDVVLAIARAVRDQMKDDPGMRPVMIRDGDYYVGLKDRRVTARRKHNADLFVSIHADAFTRRSARGASVFAVSRRGATSNTAAYLAEAENRADQLGGIDPKSDDDVVNVISDLIMEGTMSHSLHLGRNVLDAMGSFATLHKGAVEQAGFMVLKEPNMPSILVETGFISNPEEERLLKTPAYQQKLAKAVVSGVHRYFSTYPPPGTWFALHRDGVPAPAASTAVAATLPASTPAPAPATVPEPDPFLVAAGEVPPPTRMAMSTTAGDATATDADAMPVVLSRSKPAAAKPAVAKRKPQFVLHKVGRGQSLGFLAQKYGVTQRAIREANNLRRSDLYIGETLKIPKL